MAGKNKIETGVTLNYDDTGGTARDLSSSMVPGSLAINGYSYEQVGIRGVSEALDNFLAGFASLDISAQFYMDDTATTGSWTVLSAQNGANASTGYTMTIAFGSNGASPTTGDPELELDMLLTGLPVSISGGAVICTATWVPKTGTIAAWSTVGA